jgi:hypothetical protein
MEVSGQLRTQGKSPQYPLGWAQCKISAPAGNQIQVVQLMV